MKSDSLVSHIAPAREKCETKGLVKFLVEADAEEVFRATAFGIGDEAFGVLMDVEKTGLSWKELRRFKSPPPFIFKPIPYIMDGLYPLIKQE